MRIGLWLCPLDSTSSGFFVLMIPKLYYLRKTTTNHYQMHKYYNHTRTLEDKTSQREMIRLLKEQNELLRQLLFQKQDGGVPSSS